tara:strand:- start:123 stop:338 length:216 start_codon:yes stop_codon:yes gene_type:complete
MKVGDLVKRQFNHARWKEAREQHKRLGYGIVLSKHIAGRPQHRCLNVFYPKVGESYDIAESLMEVVSELET